MSMLGDVVSSVGKAVTDPGALVKDAVNTLLPKELSVVGDVAGALVDLEVPGHQLQALQHGMEALRDLPQALHTGAGSAAGAPWRGTPGFEPAPPPSWRGGPLAAGGAAGGTPLDKLLGMTDRDFMNAVRDGKIPDEVSKDPRAMLAIQDRMNRITQMTQLMTSMMQAMHQMQMAIIQNVRA